MNSIYSQLQKRAQTVAKKVNPVEKEKDNRLKKQRFESYTIDHGINLIILNAKVEKAKKNIFGNFLYKIDNNSHYEVKATLDFSNSEFINIKPEQFIPKDTLVFELKIDPFTTSENEVCTEVMNQIKNEVIIEDIHHPGKFCEIQYLIGYRINANLTKDIKFPSFEKQISLIQKDIDDIAEVYNKCLISYKNMYQVFYNIKNEKFKFLSPAKLFIDILFPPIINQLEIEMNK